MLDGEGNNWGRPVGLQIVGRHRGEAAQLQAAALFEGAVGLAQRLPIDPPRVLFDAKTRGRSPVR